MDVVLDDVLSIYLVNVVMVMCVLVKKWVWVEVEMKAGRASKGMRYVGLNADEMCVVFFVGGEYDEVKKWLKL